MNIQSETIGGADAAGQSGGAPAFTVDEETVFVLGNGPSLASVDLKALAGRATIGMNAAYRYWREIDWWPRYYACLDTVVGMSHRDAIAELILNARDIGIEGFVLRENLIRDLGAVGRNERIYNLDALGLVEPRLAIQPVTTGTHATLWAAAVGFRKVVILGVDGNYTETVAGARRREGIELEIVSDGENPNYFFAGYQRPGDRFNLPNPRPGLHLEAWDKAAAILARDGVSVVNGSPRSEVPYFPFVDAAGLIHDGAATPAPARETPRADPVALLAGENSFAPSSFVHRLRAAAEALAEHQGPLLFVGAGVSVLAVAAGAAVNEGPAVAVALILWWVLFLLMLHLRTTSSHHVGRLERRVSALEAAMADTGRRRLPRLAKRD